MRTELRSDGVAVGLDAVFVVHVSTSQSHADLALNSGIAREDSRASRMHPRASVMCRSAHQRAVSSDVLQRVPSSLLPIMKQYCRYISGQGCRRNVLYPVDKED